MQAHPRLTTSLPQPPVGTGSGNFSCPGRRVSQLSVFGSLLLFLFFPMMSAQESVAQDRLEEYLKQLKLDRLVIRQLENEVASELDRDVRLQKATRLINLYTDRLLNSQLDPETARLWIEKADGLVTIYPELDDPRFTIATLQSRYLVQERAFREWFSKRDSPQEKLLEQWQQLSRELLQFNANMETQYQSTLAEVQATSGDPLATERLARIEGLLQHSSFLIGWSSYFQGILDVSNRISLLRRADEHLRIFLQIEDEKSLTELSADWFDLNSPWNLRAVVGLALVQRGLDHPQQSNHCFDLLQQHGDGSFQDQLFVWKLNSRLFLGQILGIREVLAEFQLQPSHSLAAEVSFWSTVFSSSQILASQNQQLSLLLRSEAIAGLTRTMQAPTILEFLEQNPVEFADDFVGNWAQGYLDFYRGEASGEAPKMQSAKRYLQRAIETSGPQDSISDLARCRYLLARIFFQERNFQKASDLFQMVAAAMASEDQELAAESQWLAAQSLIELSRQDSRRSGLAYAAVENLIRRFPDSRFRTRAEFEKLRLDLAVLPGDEAIRRLERIPAADRKYPLALEELVRTRFRLWLDAFRNRQSDLENRLDALIDAEAAARREDRILIENRLKLTLLVVDALLRYDPLNRAKTKQLLDIAGQQAEAISSRSSAYAEYRYYQLTFNENIRSEAAAEVHARWLMDNAANTRFKQPGLIYLGRILEQRMQQSEHPETALVQETRAIYRRLADTLGTSEATLKQSRNAQVTMNKLAELESLLENHAEADRIYHLLLDCFPNQRQYIHGLAKTKLALGEKKAALPLWQRLAANAEAGTDDWFESKYQLIVCLLETDPPTAASVYRQTTQLSPEMPEPWRSKFAAIAQQLAPMCY